MLCSCVAEPEEYADWFEKTAGDNMTLPALQLHTSIEQQANDSRYITVDRHTVLCTYQYLHPLPLANQAKEENKAGTTNQPVVNCID